MYVKPCYEIEGGYEEDWWLYMESCVFSNIGWLNKDTIINTAKFTSIPGVADKVAQCVSTRSTEWQEGGRRKKQDKNRRGRSKKQGKGRSARRGGGRGAKGKVGKKKERREKRKGGKKTERRGQRRRGTPRETESSSLRRKGRKNKEDRDRKEQRKKKKEEKKILKSISLEKFLSEETIEQLWCIRYDNNI